MTCIVGLVSDDKVIMGGDSSAVSGWMVRPTSLDKVFRKGPFIIGYTSSFRMGQIIQHSVDLPEAETYDVSYMVTQFVEAIRSKFKEAGFSKIENSQESGGVFLVGVQGRLFEISNDYQVQEYQDGIAVVGSGEEYAFGALKANDHLSPRERVKNALEVSAYFCGSVIPPFTILEI